MVGLRYLTKELTLSLDVEKCVGCGTCILVCPHEVFVLDGAKARIKDLDGCMECGACAQNCPVSAIEVRSGVGCAAGIIRGILRGTEPTCDCAGGDDGGSCCSDQGRAARQAR